MSTGMIIFLVVLVVLIGICVGLYFFGKKAEKKQAEQKEQMEFSVVFTSQESRAFAVVFLRLQRKRKKDFSQDSKKKRTESKKFRSCQSDRSGTFLFFSSYFQISLFSDLLYSPDHSSVITLPNFSFYTLFLPRTPEAPLTLLRQGDTGLLY